MTASRCDPNKVISPISKLSTHVLDTARGRPASGVAIELFVAQGDRWVGLTQAVTNADGRTDAPLLSGPALRVGRYRLTFEMGRYFRDTGETLPDPPFVDVVTLDFGIAEPNGSYHVPLLASPWSWSTYRGS